MLDSPARPEAKPREVKSLGAFLDPEAIAIIGASNDPTRIGGRTLFNIKRGGFAGAVYPINRGREIVQDLRAYPSIEEVPGPVDCAVIALPGELVIPAVEECERKGVSALVIFSAGFNEAGVEGVARQGKLEAIIARSGMRVVGPNCLGVFNSRNGVWLSFTTLFQEPIAGPAIGMVSQSGGSAAHVLKLAQGRGLAVGTFITTGNEVDVELGEGLLALAHDPNISAIIAYIEGMRSGADLVAGLAAARRAGKPVLMLKVGRTTAGAQAAASHTASLAGEDRVYDAIFTAHGVYRAQTTEELLDVAVAAAQTRHLPAGDRLGVVTISGGMGAQIADAASAAGLVLPPTRSEAQARLKALCPPGSPLNPVDITAQLSTDPHLLVASMRVLLETGDYDAILAFFGVYANVPNLSVVFLDDLRQLRTDFPDAIMAVSVVCPPEEAARYAEAGYLVFEEPARAVQAMAALRKLAIAFEQPERRRPKFAGLPKIVAGQTFHEASAKALLAETGVSSPIEGFAQTVDAVGEVAAGLRFPVALKIVSPDILHKTEVGGVALNLASATEVEGAAVAMHARVCAAAPEARIDGFLLSEMISGGVELILGTRRDPLFGQLVLIGLGGITAELFEDVAIRPAPVDPDEALAMLRTLKTFPLLDGWRGSPRADARAAATAISIVSRLAAANAESIETIEINPLRVMTKGVVALDAVIETVR